MDITQFSVIIKIAMVDIFKIYKGHSFPRDPTRLLEEILAYPEDKELQEFYWFFLALNANHINGEKIYNSLDSGTRLIFKDAYNKAYLLLRVWSKLVSFSTGEQINLPNLFLSKEVEKNPYYFYQIIFDGEKRRIEKRWKEILNLY